jgi:hypothetical protein
VMFETQRDATRQFHCKGDHLGLVFRCSQSSSSGWRNGMTTAAQTVTRNAPETDSRKTQVTVSRAIHVLSTEN